MYIYQCTGQLSMTEKVLAVLKFLMTYILIHLGQNTLVGRRNFRPKFKTKSKNFSTLMCLMKQEIGPRNVLGHFFRQKYVLNALLKLGPGNKYRSR